MISFISNTYLILYMYTYRILILNFILFFQVITEVKENIFSFNN